MADNINISPEMINNLMDMIKNSNANSNPSSNPNQEEISNTINPSDLLSSFISNSNSNSSSNSNTSDNASSIDLETIMKIKSIIEALNTKNDPRSNLLYSLKPYLRKSKQSKLDQYANLLKITQMTDLFKNEKGEPK